jgi:hypothetical protein
MEFSFHSSTHTDQQRQKQGKTTGASALLKSSAANLFSQGPRNALFSSQTKVKQTSASETKTARQDVASLIQANKAKYAAQEVESYMKAIE